MTRVKKCVILFLDKKGRNKLKNISVLGYIFKVDEQADPSFSRGPSLQRELAGNIANAIFKLNSSIYKVNNVNFSAKEKMLAVGLTTMEKYDNVLVAAHFSSKIVEPEEISEATLNELQRLLDDNDVPFKVLNDDEFSSVVTDPRVSSQGGAQVYLKYIEPKDEKDFKIEKLEQEISELKRNLESKEEKEADK